MSSRPVQQETPIEKSKPKVLQNAPKRPDTLASKIVPRSAPTVKLIGNGICVGNTDQIEKVVNELIRKAKGNQTQVILSDHFQRFFIPITAPPSKQLSINIFKTEDDINEKIRQLQETEKRLADMMESQKTSERFQTNVQQKLLDFVKTLTSE